MRRSGDLGLSGDFWWSCDFDWSVYLGWTGDLGPSDDFWRSGDLWWSVDFERLCPEKISSVFFSKIAGRSKGGAGPAKSGLGEIDETELRSEISELLELPDPNDSPGTALVSLW